MPIAQSTVTLWAAGAGAPRAARTNEIGQGWPVRDPWHNGNAFDSSLYLVATSGVSGKPIEAPNNPAIALITVLGANPPARVVLNEMTTVASVWTNAQFLDDTTLKGQPLSLRIAAGNVPNFVDVETGGWGGNPGPPQQQPDANHGEFRDPGRSAGRLRYAGEGGCVQQPVRGSRASGGRPPDQHPKRSRIDRP